MARLAVAVLLALLAALPARAADTSSWEAFAARGADARLSSSLGLDLSGPGRRPFAYAMAQTALDPETVAALPEAARAPALRAALSKAAARATSEASAALSAGAAPGAPLLARLRALQEVSPALAPEARGELSRSMERLRASFGPRAARQIDEAARLWSGPRPASPPLLSDARQAGLKPYRPHPRAAPQAGPSGPALPELGPLPDGLTAADRRALFDGLYTDRLTGLLNNRYLEARAAELVSGHGELVLMDGDGFGAVDRELTARYGAKGRAAADEVLARMAADALAAARAAAGPGAVGLRKGGEEFAFFVASGRGAAAAQAVRRAGERFRADNLELAAVLPAFGVSDDPAVVMRAIQKRAADEAAAKGAASERGPPGAGTISAGAAAIDRALPPAEALREALRKADAALSGAKEGGKGLAAVFEEAGVRILDRLEPGPSAQRERAASDAAAAAGRRERTRRAALKLRRLDAAAYARYRELSERDPVSGLKDYESIRSHLGELFGASGRPGRFDHILVLELDSFKAFNDHPRLGHAVGDAALKGFGEAATRTARELGLDARLLVADGESGVHLARSHGKQFQALGAEADLRRFALALEARLRSEQPVLAEAARASFGAPEATADRISAVRRMLQAQARALGKNPVRVGLATAALEPVKDAADYDAAVARAEAALEAAKAGAASRYIDTNVLIYAKSRGLPPESGRLAPQTAYEISVGGPEMRRYAVEQIKAGRIALDPHPSQMTPQQRAQIETMAGLLTRYGVEPKDARIVAQIAAAAGGAGVLHTRERRLTNQIENLRRSRKFNAELARAGLEGRLPQVVRVATDFAGRP